jgi:hypothetical protein
MVLISTWLYPGKLVNELGQNAYERSSLLSWALEQRPGEWI